MTRPAFSKRHLRSAVTALVIAGAFMSALGLGTVQARPNFQGQPTSPNGLVINEIFDSQGVASEYFELYNTSGAAIDLSTYVIYNRDGNTPLSNLDDTMIAAGQVRAIGPTQLHTPTIAGSGLARTDFLGLVNTSPTDQVIDVVNYGSPPDISWPNYERFQAYFFPAGTIPQLPEDNPKDIQRWPDGLDTDQGRDFQLIARSPGALSCGDPYEDDNSLTTAYPHGLGTVLHRICPSGDVDYMSITMSPSITYTLRADPYSQTPRIDTVLRLYDASGLELAVDDPPLPNRSSVIVFRPTTAGTFRAQVTDKNNAGTAGFDYLYNFSVEAQSVPPTPSVSATPTTPPCVDQYEPDNAADPRKVLEQNTEQMHTLCRSDSPQADEDWMALNVTAGKVYSMFTKDLAGPIDTIITLYDSDLDVLAENDDYQPGTNLTSRIDYSFGTAGTYYLRVRDTRGGNNVALRYTVALSTTGGLPPTGTPTASPTTNPNSPTPTQPPCGDAFEPDGVAETARTILIGATQRHSVCPAADADWVRFYARAGKVYTIRTSNLGIGLDSYMYLFDTDASNILAQNDDGGEGVASRIDFYPQRDDWYFVQVKNAGDLGLPDMFYDLSLAVVPGVPQPPGTATAIIAPPVTVTAAAGGSRTPTTVVQPTRPPLPTPTQGAIPPTPAAVATTPPGPVEPTEVVPAPPTQTPVVEETPVVPGVPVTGGHLPDQEVAAVAAAPKAPVSAPPVEQLAPMLFRVFYDRDLNSRFGRGEGIRGIAVYLLDANANTETARIVTSGSGDGTARLPLKPQRIYVPYLGISMPLNDFPHRELHSLWVPAVQLPDRVP